MGAVVGGQGGGGNMEGVTNTKGPVKTYFLNIHTYIKGV